jgi:hypothetical protein
MRLDIRKEQVEAKDILMCKLRDKIQKGYVPTTKEEFAGVLRLVAEHAKLVGGMEECQEILEKLSEGKPVTMEKFGVECNNDHDPKHPYMEKKASGKVQCRHCGTSFDSVAVADGVKLSAKVTPGKPQEKKGDVERMFNV